MLVDVGGAARRTARRHAAPTPPGKPIASFVDERVGGRRADRRDERDRRRRRRCCARPRSAERGRTSRAPFPLPPGELPPRGTLTRAASPTSSPRYPAQRRTRPASRCASTCCGRSPRLSPLCGASDEDDDRQHDQPHRAPDLRRRGGPAHAHADPPRAAATSRCCARSRERDPAATRARRRSAAAPAHRAPARERRRARCCPTSAARSCSRP